MRPNLKSLNIIKLQFSIFMPLNTGLITQIQKAAPPDDEGDSLFVDAYSIGKIHHRAWVWLIRPRKDSEDYKIEFNYELRKAGRLSKKIPRINNLMHILSEIDQEPKLDCEVTFQFGKRERVKTVVILPMKLVDLPNMPFNEIRGVYLVQRKKDLLEYDVTMTLNEDGTLFESVSLNFTSKISDSIVDEVIERASKISNNFVIKG